ncbi:signal peptidase II [bacterium]|nr:signal peptidase II [bacterium]
MRERDSEVIAELNSHPLLEQHKGERNQTSHSEESFGRRDKRIKTFGMTHIYIFAIFSSILILDQVTKHLILSFMNPYKSIPIIPGFFDIVYVMNKGGAFGIWSGQSPLFRGIIFISFSIVTILALGIIYIKSDKEHITRLGIAFLMAGAIGNLIDRLRWGMVVDFMDFYISSLHWPAFNVADMAICFGLGLILLNLIKNPVIHHT